ncbi:MAG: hypothetical protein ACRD1V_21350, partial [Vicinamibacterales bacterium]
MNIHACIASCHIIATRALGVRRRTASSRPSSASVIFRTGPVLGIAASVSADGRFAPSRAQDETARLLDN